MVQGFRVLVWGLGLRGLGLSIRRKQGPRFT